MSAFSILIIDDEVNNFDVIEAMLASQDYQFNYADNGQEAISSLEIFQPDLVLLDVMMPGMDGIETCQHIKALPDWQAVPIIMITALNTKEDLARCLNAGADDFIGKPIQRVELSARVNAMLRIKQQYDEIQMLMALRENMVDMIIHDFRIPLRGTLSGLELLEQEALPPAEQQAILNATYTSAQTLESMIGNLLQTALIEAGKPCLNRTNVHLGDFMQSVMAGLIESLAKSSHSVQLELPKETIGCVAIDVDIFSQALEKLVLSMLQLTSTYSHIVLRLQQSDLNEFTIQIMDTASDIADSFEQILLEKYQTNASTPLAHVKLGLTFCKRVVEAHGGQLGIQRNQPTGSIVAIVLPG